ncbi:head-tail connector protein [Bordetella bronchiseptica]|uniref:head-tail connector protein n=1 Tax=Bordetella bronchiseptica TaxID=518 RepID=UPI000461ABEA|nr:head-tail connector protein [Bordetella bronchiseptica]KDD50166.1 Phage gp6-like head-tail connector protein [Bordetella bronchiseptica MBORD901]
MAAPPTLEDAKAQLRVDGNSLDPQIELLLKAAIANVSDTLGRPVPWTQEGEDGTSESVCPWPVSAAILLQLEALFGPKGAAPDVNNRAIMALLTPYRINMGV